MIKKKLLALGLIAVMALGQSSSVFAAGGTYYGNYYVSNLAYNASYGLITGSVSYTPTNSNSKELSDRVEVICNVGGEPEEFSKTTYGVNETSTTLTIYKGTPKKGFNIGSVKNVNTYEYEEFGETTTKF